MKTKAQIERAERAERRAANARAEADAAIEATRRIGAGIPMGQPILVGHHSEKRHRRDIARMDAGMRKSVALMNTAKSLAYGNAGTALLADDPELVVALKAKLAKLEAERAEIKAFNKKARKEKTEAHPKWMLSNLGANIRRVKQRLVDAEAMAASQDVHYENPAFDYIEDTEAVRLRLIFAMRPSKEECRTLKSSGFRWAPSEGAWQRQLTGAARYKAKVVLNAFFGVDLDAELQK